MLQLHVARQVRTRLCTMNYLPVCLRQCSHFQKTKVLLKILGTEDLGWDLIGTCSLDSGLTICSTQQRVENHHVVLFIGY